MSLLRSHSWADCCCLRVPAISSPYQTAPGLQPTGVSMGPVSAQSPTQGVAENPKVPRLQESGWLAPGLFCFCLSISTCSRSGRLTPCFASLETQLSSLSPATGIMETLPSLCVVVLPSRMSFPFRGRSEPWLCLLPAGCTSPASCPIPCCHPAVFTCVR